MTKNIKIFLQPFMIKTDLLTTHHDLIRSGCYYNLLTKLYCNKKVIWQYRVNRPYNYHRVVHLHKINAKIKDRGYSSFV